jgi:hypothetical protein
MKFEFIISLKTAQQIGLTVPPNVWAKYSKPDGAVSNQRKSRMECG